MNKLIIILHVFFQLTSFPSLLFSLSFSPFPFLPFLFSLSFSPSPHLNQTGENDNQGHRKIRIISREGGKKNKRLMKITTALISHLLSLSESIDQFWENNSSQILMGFLFSSQAAAAAQFNHVSSYSLLFSGLTSFDQHLYTQHVTSNS